MIHFNSYIHPNAKVATNVKIDPFTVIHQDVVIGQGTWIGSNVTIEEGTRIGKNCKIFPGTVIGSEPQDKKYAGEKTVVEIGDNCVIREFVTIHRGTSDRWKTVVGSGCWVLAYSHIGHDCIIGNHCTLSNSTQIAGHVTLGDYVGFGGVCAVHQFVKIGSHAFIAGGSLVSTPTTGMVAGTYEVALFFAEFQKKLTAPDITNNFFPTFGGYKTVTLKVFTLNITLTGSVEVPKVNYNVSINNSETIGFTLMNCYIIFRYGTRTPSDPAQSGEGQVALGNINCPVGSTQVLSGQILNVAYDFVDRGGRLYFTTNSGSQFNRNITL